MACRLFGAKPLTSGWLLSMGPLGTNFRAILIKKQKCIRKYRLRSGGHFVEGGDELNILLNDWRELSQILLM